MKVYLDDIRTPPDNSWIIVRTYAGAADLITNNYQKITEISLDHDLGGEYDGVTIHKNGYDIALLIEELAYKTKYVPKILVHSMNPVGLGNINRCIEAIHRLQNEATRR